jgi:hypothetical protein
MRDSDTEWQIGETMAEVLRERLVELETLEVGQRVRFKSTSAARYWNIPQDAQGTVMCSYRLLTSNRARADRLDVRFTPQLVIWGGAAEDFEEIRDDPERTVQ